MKRVMHANMHSTHVADSDEQDTEADSDGASQSIHSSLSAPPNMPSESWKRVVAKAHAIAADSSSMSAVPGGNVRSRFVVSQPRKRQNQDENFSPSSDSSMCRKKLSLETKNLSPCNSKDCPLSLLAHQPQPQKATSVSNPCSNMENDRPPSTSVSNPSHPPPLLLQDTHLHPLSPSFPPPLIPATSLMSPVLPLTQIQITQQPTSCSLTSMTVSQPSCSYTLPSISQTSQTTDFQQPVSPPTSRETFSKPFFVKFLTRQIKICQGCRSGYQRDPPYDIVIGHFERQQYCD